MAVAGGGNLTVNSEFPDAEFGATEKQQIEASNGCLGRSAKVMKSSDRSELVGVISQVQTDLAKALDIVKSKRSRIRLQKVFLNDELKKIGDGSSTMSKFHRLASGAIGSCQEAMTASTNAKSASDLIYSKGNELRYRQGLLEMRDVALAGEESKIANARTALDKMTLSLEQA